MGNSNAHPPKVKFNIRLFGDTCSGNTCLFLAYENVEEHDYSDDDWIYCLDKDLTIQNVPAKLKIWDVPRDELLRRLMPQLIHQDHNLKLRFLIDLIFYIYPARADGIFLMYDVSRIVTFQKLPQLLESMRTSNPGAIIFIIASQCAASDKKEVPRETGLKFAQEEKLEFFEICGETRQNINFILEYMTLRLLQKKGLIPVDKPEIEGKSLGRTETNEKINTTITKQELWGSISEKEHHGSSITKERVSEQRKAFIEGIPPFLEEGKALSKIDTHCSVARNVDDLDVVKKGDISSTPNKDESSVLDELVLFEEEMQFAGKKPLEVYLIKNG